jgi:DNA-binding response OmpR family regulator
MERTNQAHGERYGNVTAALPLYVRKFRSILESMQPTLGDAARRTILFVDDERCIVDTSAKLLRRAGFRVIVATDLKCALEIVEREADRIELIVADVRLKEIEGQELVSALRSRGLQAPVLYVSGDKWESLAEDYGQEPFLAKPWESEELVSSIQVVLSSNSQARSR